MRVPGPPFVITNTISKIRTRSKARIMMAINITGHMAGNEIRKKVAQNPAPSIAAASVKSVLTLDNAAKRIKNINGNHCQISAISITGYTQLDLLPK